MEEGNQLEPIFWVQFKWMNKKGKKVSPEQIGNSFTLGKHRYYPGEREGERFQKDLQTKLKILEGERYITKEQRQKVNAYSAGGSDAIATEIPVCFYII